MKIQKNQFAILGIAVLLVAVLSQSNMFSIITTDSANSAVFSEMKPGQATQFNIQFSSSDSYFDKTKLLDYSCVKYGASMSQPVTLVMRTEIIGQNSMSWNDEFTTNCQYLYSVYQGTRMNEQGQLRSFTPSTAGTYQIKQYIITPTGNYLYRMEMTGYVNPPPTTTLDTATCSNGIISTTDKNTLDGIARATCMGSCKASSSTSVSSKTMAQLKTEMCAGICTDGTTQCHPNMGINYMQKCEAGNWKTYSCGAITNTCSGGVCKTIPGVVVVNPPPAIIIDTNTGMKSCPDGSSVASSASCPVIQPPEVINPIEEIIGTPDLNETIAPETQICSLKDGTTIELPLTDTCPIGDDAVISNFKTCKYQNKNVQVLKTQNCPSTDNTLIYVGIGAIIVIGLLSMFGISVFALMGKKKKK